MLEKWTKQLGNWRRHRAEKQFKPGSLVRGKYKIIYPLGEGSYGIAYLCHDVSDKNRPCVLKRVQPVRGGQQRSAAVHNHEIRMLSRLRHPSIPVLYEHFRYCGYYCFTMEYAPGASLEKLLFEDDAVFSELDSLLIVDKLLKVIEYVHSESIVHRDIRIANVLLDGNTVRLVDFGLARSFDPLSSDSTPADDVQENDPMEKKIRRRIDPTSDFYGAGHLLLFLLYSGYPEPNETGPTVERSWEEELSDIHPMTKRLLRRMLLAEQPYEHVHELQADVRRTIEALGSGASD